MNSVLDEARLQQHHAENFSEERIFALRNEFARNGFIKLRDVVENSPLIGALSKSEVLLGTLSLIAGTRIVASVSQDEEYLITKQERKGDTHGWHWGDYSFALIWIIETPPIAKGGMLQCVPHTSWDKSNPRIHEFLCSHPSGHERAGNGVDSRSDC